MHLLFEPSTQDGHVFRRSTRAWIETNSQTSNSSSVRLSHLGSTLELSLGVRFFVLTPLNET